MILVIIDILNATNLTIGLPFNKKGKWLYEAERHKGPCFLTEGKVT
jgi:hypothetical protein